jgi:hypothetical protein
MCKMLLAAATGLAVATTAMPANAQRLGDPGLSISVGAHSDFHGDNRRHRQRGDSYVWIPDELAYQNNRTFDPSAFNDWWHDTPSRAYPRWVQSGKCERLWWSGGGWRC